MKKSLFSKLMSAYLIVMIISYILLSIFLSIWFYEYYFEKRKVELLKEGDHIETLVKQYATGDINKADLNIQISVIERILKSQITIFDSYGFKIESLDKEGNASDLNKGINKEDFLLVMEGREVVKAGEFKDLFGSYTMTVGIPVNISDSVTYAIFMNSSLNEVKETLFTVYFVIWVAAFFAITISAFIIYYFSEKILINPLSRITNTAKQISKGEFSDRVEVISQDEIGDLAASFNYMADSRENLDNMRKSFSADVSHELRSPMTSINGFIEGMLDGTISYDKWEKYLKVVNGESKRLIRMINELLDLARIESGEFSMKIGSFEINELISESILKFEDRVYDKNVKMTVKLIKHGQSVKGDRDRINQVITNLVDNSLKFVPNGGIIEVSAVPKGKKVVVSVFNSGEPIPKEDIELIWERFHKVDKARVRNKSGVGLGLSIVRKIVNKHNETIWAESSPDGNAFSFTLSMD